MQLQSLIDEQIKLQTNDDVAAVSVAGLTSDSRQVGPGFIFAALAGANTDGVRFVGDAVAQGAAAILCSDDAVLPGDFDIPVLRSREPRQALALMAARFYGRQPQTAVAVTGTSGKTSVVEFTRQIYASLGRRAASLGTIGLVKPDGGIYGSLTTPDPVSLHESLADLADDGVTHIAFEASSHGLDQYRLDGVRLTAGAFTNLGRDHMDYHATVENYFAAKMRLFLELLKPGQTAVIDMDDTRSTQVKEVAKHLDVITVGNSGETLRLVSVHRDGFRQKLEIEHEGCSHSVMLPLIGAYQVSNALVAAGLAIATGEVPRDVFAALETLQGVKGRLDIVGEAKGGLAVVDYAHKPEALAAALDALRPFVSGKLICVVGCGGDRDKGKRPIMGQIAVDKSDVVFVTDDNPRSEDATLIRLDILSGALPVAAQKSGGRDVVREVGDRAAAITEAVEMMGEGDVVLVAGKGHETGQIIQDRVLPFSDHEEILRALEHVSPAAQGSK